MTVETCPGPMNASIRMSGESRIARIAGNDGDVVAEDREVLDAQRLARACSVSAVDGAVVSKPIAKNTTWRSGLACASFSASSGE